MESRSTYGSSTTYFSAPPRHEDHQQDQQSQSRFLACLRCRGKKAKCDNIQAVCGACAKANAECVRPTERRRKRTRKEMEEAERERDRQGGENGKNRRGYDGNVVVARPSGPIPNTHTVHIPQHSHPPALMHAHSGHSGYPNSFPGPLNHQRIQTSSSSGPRYSPIDDIKHRSSFGTPPQPNVLLNGQQANTDSPSEVVEALSKQIAYLEGDPGESQTLKVHYYRFSGSTAIHPGFNRITIKLRSSTGGSAASSPSISTSAHQSCDEPLQDISHLPPDETLIQPFFTYFGQHFPFLNKRRVEERIAGGTMSAFLLHAMNSLAVRFAPAHQHRPSQCIAAAWGLALPLLRVPSRDVVGGLLLLAWAEFGENSESGLWNFSGLAIRMALDLGLHKNDDQNSDDEEEEDVCFGKLLFWALFVMDRILAFGTGRSVTIQEETIEVPLPTDEDMPPGPVMSAFVRSVRLFALAGRIANVLNGSRGSPRTLVSNSPPSPDVLQGLHNQLVDFLEGLPAELCWSVDNFRAQSAHFQGGAFLFLHLWANAVLALIHHPNLGRNLSPSGIDTPVSAGVQRSIKLSLASSRQIADCLVFADLFDAASYCATPFVNQCLFIAGVAFIHDAQSSDDIGGVGEQFLHGLVRQNLSALFKALKRMETYWSGLGYIIDVLEQRASGRGWARVDFSISGDKGKNFISLPDTGILRRITKKMETPTSSPQQEGNSGALNAPPRGASSLSNWSFESLLNNYQVEEVTASAPTGFDFSGVFPDGFTW